MEKKKIQQEAIDKIINSANTSMIREFFRSKKTFYNDLINSINYVKLNKEYVDKSLGEDKAKSFINGLLLLKRLIEFCIS